MRTATDPTPVARDFYAQLAQQGFTHDQVVDLATRLLDHVKDDLRRQREPLPSK